MCLVYDYVKVILVDTFLAPSFITHAFSGRLIWYMPILNYGLGKIVEHYGVWMCSSHTVVTFPVHYLSVVLSSCQLILFQPRISCSANIYMMDAMLKHAFAAIMLLQVIDKIIFFAIS